MPPSGDIDLAWAYTYWTHEELFGRAMSASELVEVLEQLAIGDCLEALGRLSCLVEGGDVALPERQQQIIRRVGLGDAIADEFARLAAQREPHERRSFFFPQQVVHLTRLAIRHAAHRPRDRFDAGKLAGHFMRALFGVTDLFGNELANEGPDTAISFILRQSGLGERAETLYVFSRYYELLVRLWTKVQPSGDFETAEAFRRFTGLTLEEYFTIGFATYTRFLDHIHHDEEPADFALRGDYFATTKITSQQWRAFTALLVATPDQLRDALDAEDAAYGPTLYRSHVFDRKPLVQIDGDVIVPTSFAALERAVTEGPFWILADAAEAEGRKREDFTSPFGRVFERFAQESLERVARLEPRPPRTFRDVSYGPKKASALSSDMTFIYESERQAIFFEVVTGRPSVATMTRGDITAYQRDVARLVLKKADQLRRRWRDFMQFGTLKFDGIGRGQIHTVWPVIVLIEGFPLLPPIYGDVERRVRRSGWPRNVPRMTLIDADELAAIETLVERGWTTLGVLRRWKRTAPEAPLSNWLTTVPELQHEPLGHAAWHEQSFRDLTDVVTDRIFGHRLDVLPAPSANDE